MRTAVFVYASLILSVIVYARFCTLVINDITEYLGIACFTVRKKNEKGEWQKLGANGEPNDKRL
jgi:ethanolaminephosphotransferase